MSLGAVVAPAVVEAQPGCVTTCDVRVRNSGGAGQNVSLEVAGQAAGWAWVVPHQLSLPPASDAVARICFRPPRSATPVAGPVPFQVKVVGSAESYAPTLADGVVEVAPFTDLSVALTPRTSRGRQAGEHLVTVENRGNAPAHVELSGADPDGALAVAVDAPALVVHPGRRATARVDVRTRRRLLWGRERGHSFQVLVHGAEGAPAVVTGTMRQEAAVPNPRAGVALALVALVLGLALLRVTVLSAGAGRTTLAEPGGVSAGPPSPDVEPPPTDFAPGSLDGPGDFSPGAAAAPSPECPAAGHQDPGVTGFSGPDERQLLPRDYSFTFTGPDRCTPSRFNPCEPIHYVVNDRLAPPDGVADVEEAFARLSRATGMTFVNDGTTNEPFDEGRRSYQPQRYGERWAPILIVWTRMGEGGDVQVVGRGSPSLAPGAEVIVSGVLGLNVDAVTDAQRRTPLRGGFGSDRTPGPIGPTGVTWGRVILHELAHVVNLGHSGDPAQLMYPETVQQTSPVAEFGEGDLAGLRILGRGAGCLPTPVPTHVGPAAASPG